MKNKQLPDKLYQYQPYDGRTLGNLINKHIYLGSPERFNDPFECRFSMSPPKLEDIPQLRKILEEIVSVTPLL
ncbi:MAG: hypothetical protein V3V05_10760 [Pontiella sp.]